MDHSADIATDIPLVVDLDGTLIKVDSLHEAFVSLITINPLAALCALARLPRGRAQFKAAIAEHVNIDPLTVPFDEHVLRVINEARSEGRKVYLATAADKRFATTIAESAGVFDGIFSSDNFNLAGDAKAAFLVEKFGKSGFDYVGNSKADLSVWAAARQMIVAGSTGAFAKQQSHRNPVPILLHARDTGWTSHLKALRPHQWLKNLLLFLPALAGHQFGSDTLFPALVAFVSFSFAASSVYLINDLVDLPHDRAHPEKRNRPIAAGIISLSHAAFMFICLFALSISLALSLSQALVIAIAGYFALAISYSLYFKRKLMIDVVVLAALYGIRVVAGTAVTGIIPSQWLVAFCFFIFLSLALMKRTTEIILLPKSQEENIKGRGYRRSDLPILNALTVASGFVAVLVLAFYINSPDVKVLYRTPDLLWGICIILVYWLGRAFFLTGRGEMRQDPVIFAATDRNSLLSGLIVMVIFAAAI